MIKDILKVTEITKLTVTFTVSENVVTATVVAANEKKSLPPFSATGTIDDIQDKFLSDFSKILDENKSYVTDALTFVESVKKAGTKKSAKEEPEAGEGISEKEPPKKVSTKKTETSAKSSKGKSYSKVIQESLKVVQDQQSEELKLYYAKIALKNLKGLVPEAQSYENLVEDYKKLQSLVIELSNKLSMTVSEEITASIETLINGNSLFGEETKTNDTAESDLPFKEDPKNESEPSAPLELTTPSEPPVEDLSDETDLF